uniref:(northern house mosquito) hypothetical protein n=1 Tax=Culex pipiens TaxID=7175 RepID=A0A8D8F3H3_CULPI
MASKLLHESVFPQRENLQNESSRDESVVESGRERSGTDRERSPAPPSPPPQWKQQWRNGCKRGQGSEGGRCRAAAATVAYQERQSAQDGHAGRECETNRCDR